MNKIDNTLLIVKKVVKHYKLKLSYITIKEYLLAHPEYPSLKSITDSLQKWGINHTAIRVSKIEMAQLDEGFIVHSNTNGGMLFFVESISKGKVKYFYDKNKIYIEDFESFSKKASGAVIIFDRENISKTIIDKSNLQIERLNKHLPYLTILSFLFLMLYIYILKSNINSESNNIILLLIGTKLVGIISSIFLIFHELKIETVGDKLCKLNSKTDCDTVLNSKMSRIYGWLKWSDIGLLYFVTTLFYFINSQSIISISTLGLISIFSIFYPLISIIYQYFILKRWCPFCLIVQFILIIEFIILMPRFKDIEIINFDFLGIFPIFFITATLWILFRKMFEYQQDFERKEKLLFTLKRDPNIFNYYLKKNQNNLIKYENSLSWGNRNYSIEITAFLSLDCNPCAKIFETLKELLANNPNIKLELIFSSTNDEKKQKIINTIYHLHKNNNSSESLKYISLWYSGTKNSRQDIPILKTSFNYAKELLNSRIFEKNKIPGTPTIFINNYKFPIEYDFSNIEYFIPYI